MLWRGGGAVRPPLLCLLPLTQNIFRQPISENSWPKTFYCECPYEKIKTTNLAVTPLRALWNISPKIAHGRKGFCMLDRIWSNILLRWTLSDIFIWLQCFQLLIFNTLLYIRICLYIYKFIPDRNSESGAYVSSNLCYFICSRHLNRSKAVTNKSFFLRKYLFSYRRAQHVQSYHLIYVPRVKTLLPPLHTPNQCPNLWKFEHTRQRVKNHGNRRKLGSKVLWEKSDGRENQTGEKRDGKIILHN